MNLNGKTTNLERPIAPSDELAPTEIAPIREEQQSPEATFPIVGVRSW